MAVATEHLCRQGGLAPLGTAQRMMALLLLAVRVLSLPARLSFVTPDF